MEKICCDHELVFLQVGISVFQAQCPKCKTYYQRRVGSTIVYKTTDAGRNWVCDICNSEISGTSLAHPVHDGPFPLSGSGRVLNEIVPFCPNCENDTLIQATFLK